jgi:hypothetical protein
MQQDPQLKTKLPPLQISPITKFKISEIGQIEFEGDITDKQTQETLLQLLNQADYYRQNAQKLEREKIDKNTNIDFAIISFVSVFLFMIMIMTYSAVSAISHQFQPKSNTQEIDFRF